MSWCTLDDRADGRGGVGVGVESREWVGGGDTYITTIVIEVGRTYPVGTIEVESATSGGGREDIFSGSGGLIFYQDHVTP